MRGRSKTAPVSSYFRLICRNSSGFDELLCLYPLKGGSAVARSPFKVRFALVIVIVLIMFALHNSFWLWRWDGRLPLLFGFMPFAFSFYVLYAFVAVAALALIIRLAWPDPPAGTLEPDHGKEGIQS